MTLYQDPEVQTLESGDEWSRGLVVPQLERNVLSSVRLSESGTGQTMGAWGRAEGGEVLPPALPYELAPSPPAAYWIDSLQNVGVLTPPGNTGAVQLNFPYVYTPGGHQAPAWQVPNLVTPTPAPWDEQLVLGLQTNVKTLPQR